MSVKGGTVVSLHASEGPYGGSFGEIAADDNRHYTWDVSNVFRNGTHMRVGQRVLFSVVAYTYATDISAIEKSV